MLLQSSAPAANSGRATAVIAFINCFIFLCSLDGFLQSHAAQRRNARKGYSAQFSWDVLCRKPASFHLSLYFNQLSLKPMPYPGHSLLSAHRIGAPSFCDVLISGINPRRAEMAREDTGMLDSAITNRTAPGAASSPANRLYSHVA